MTLTQVVEEYVIVKRSTGLRSLRFFPVEAFAT